MIQFRNVTHVISRNGRRYEMLSHASFQLPSNRRIALLRLAENERRPFIQLLCGMTLPARGRIDRACAVSFPVGYLGGFRPNVSVRQNVAHAARIYGANHSQIIDYVDRLCGFGPAFDLPYKNLLSSMKIYLATVLAFSIPFDFYVLSREFNLRTMSPGLADLIEQRAKSSGMIVPTANMRFVKEFCDMAITLSDGRVFIFSDVDEAIRLANAQFTNI